MTRIFWLCKKSLFPGNSVKKQQATGVIISDYLSIATARAVKTKNDDESQTEKCFSHCCLLYMRLLTNRLGMLKELNSLIDNG